MGILLGNRGYERPFLARHSAGVLTLVQRAASGHSTENGSALLRWPSDTITGGSLTRWRKECVDFFPEGREVGHCRLVGEDVPSEEAITEAFRKDGDSWWFSRGRQRNDPVLDPRVARTGSKKAPGGLMG